MKDEDKIYLIIICVIWALFRFPFVQLEPLQLDEALYGQMTNELLRNFTLQPVFMGEIVSWRPIGYFLINAPFVLVGKALALNVDLTYRLSSLFFSFLTCFALYFLIKTMYKRADLAFVGTLFYQANFINVFVSNRGLTDSVLMFFIITSLYFYFRGKNTNDFLFGGALAFAAYFVKTVMAFAIPFLVVAYWLFKDKEKLRDKYLLISLLAIPFAIFIVGAIMQASDKQLGSDISNHLVKFDASDKNFAKVMVSSAVFFFVMIGLYLGFFTSGLKKIAAFDPFLIIWLSMLPFLIWGAQVGMPWYLLPAMPAVGIVIALGTLDKKHKFDAFASMVFTILIMLTFAMTAYFYIISAEPHYENEAGEYLAGKDNVYIMGYYVPGLLFYKNNQDAKTENICTIVTGMRGENDTYKAFVNSNKEDIDNALVQAYSREKGKYDFNTRWTDAFWDKRPLRAGCTGFEAEYVALAGVNPEIMQKLGNFTLVKNISNKILIYKNS